MHNKRHLLLITLAALITTSLSFIPNSGSLVNTATAQSPICNNGVVTSGSPSHALPVILIHGYKENSNVWSAWEDLLLQNNIPFCTVSFLPSFNFLSDYDACGSAAEHAKDIEQIVQTVKDVTGKDKVNIVAHSKGGLDARLYLANNLSNNNIANLIMIGTPNKGTQLADENSGTDSCTPAILDFTTNSPTLHAAKNPNTKYHTIAGNWVPFIIQNWVFPFTPPLVDANCIELSNWYFIQLSGRFNINGPDDGLVPLNSAETPQFHKLGETSKCHTKLLDEDAFNLASPILGQ